jgi:hypothetical protein
MLVALVICCIAVYAFRDKLWELVEAMWKDDQNDDETG